jgi:asparagine synthase (glutamine-hydrolysing)
LVDEVVYTQEEPFGGPSIFMQYFVMQEAKKNNCLVLLDGQGGDETLFGYESYYSFYFASLLSNFNVLKYFLDFKTLKTFKVTRKKIFRDSIIDIFRNNLSFIERIVKNKKTFLKINHDRKRLNDIYSFKKFKKFQSREIMLRSLPRLMKYEDKNSMRNSIETRLPFVDYKFVKSALSIRDDLKFSKGYLKYILRKVASNILPEKVVWRTNKFGFEAPTDLWLEKHKDEMVSAISNSDIIEQLVEVSMTSFKNKHLLWRLYNIAVWERIYNVKL